MFGQWVLVNDRPFSQLAGYHSLPQVLKMAAFVPLCSQPQLSTNQTVATVTLQISSEANSVSILSHHWEGKMKEAG